MSGERNRHGEEGNTNKICHLYWEDDVKRLLNVDEAAALLGISKAVLYRYTSTRKKITFVKFNRRVLFDEDKLKEFVDEHSVEPIITSIRSNSED